MGSTALSREDTTLMSAVYRYWRTYAVVMNELGIDYRRFKQRKTWDRDAVVAELRRLHAAGELAGASHLRTTPRPDEH